MDRVDTGFSIRLRDFAVRRHGRAGVPRDRTRADCIADGAARDAYRRPRSRIQQCEHLWEPPASDVRRPHRRGPLGAAVLRTFVEMLRSGAGHALVADGQWRWVHLFVQWTALPVCGYHSNAASAAGEPSAGPHTDGRE